MSTAGRWREILDRSEWLCAGYPLDYRSEGSLLAVVATDAPLSARQLGRVARRVPLAVGRTGTISRDGCGDLFLAFATGNRIPAEPRELTRTLREVDDGRLNPVFQAAEEAVEEAILNALTMATTTFGRDDHVAHAIPLDRLREVMRKYGRLKEPERETLRTPRSQGDFPPQG